MNYNINKTFFKVNCNITNNITIDFTFAFILDIIILQITCNKVIIFIEEIICNITFFQEELGQWRL